MTIDLNTSDHDYETSVTENNGENVAPLVPYVIEHRWRRLTLPIMQLGKRVEKYLAPVVVEWLDRGTGVIMSDADARKDPRYRHPLRVSERCGQREYALTALRPEVKAFALFVLQFRNRRRGITPGIQTLVKWYAKCTNKRPENVRRNIQRLQDARIIEGDSLVGKLWQITDVSAIHAQEDALASLRLATMQLRT